MSFSSSPFSALPFSSSTPLAHPTLLASIEGEFGWAAWTYSKTAKLNAWAWHGLGDTGTANISGWAQLGTSLYMRRDGDDSIYLLQADVFLEDSEANTESQSVYAETQWLDFGKPGVLKGITGLDFDGKNIDYVEFFMSVDGDRLGTSVLTVALSQDGWTYSGGIIPVELASTEFKMRFVGSAGREVQINRLTVYFDELGSA